MPEIKGRVGPNRPAMHLDKSDCRDRDRSHRWNYYRKNHSGRDSLLVATQRDCLRNNLQQRNTQPTFDVIRVSREAGPHNDTLRHHYMRGSKNPTDDTLFLNDLSNFVL